MIKPAYRQIILEMVNKDVSLREISRILKVSRNTVRNVIKRGEAPESVRNTKYIEDIPVIRELFRECRGNIVRVHEELVPCLKSLFRKTDNLSCLEFAME